MLRVLAYTCLEDSLWHEFLFRLPRGDLASNCPRDTSIRLMPLGKDSSNYTQGKTLVLHALRIPYLDMPREAPYLNTPNGMPRPQHALGSFFTQEIPEVYFTILP